MPCYHPANFQTRALTCTGGPTKADGGGAHNVMRDASGVAETEPDVAAAIEAYWSLSWVGIAEFYHASKCLYGGNGNVFEPFLNVPTNPRLPSGMPVQCLPHPACAGRHCAAWPQLDAH